MNKKQKTELIKRNTSEIITDEELSKILDKEEPTAYIGYAPTGMMHIGHFTTIRKIADFIEAGFNFKFLIADVHAELDIEKTPRKLVNARSKYYKKAIKGMLDASGIDEEKIDFIKGSEFQHDKDYQKAYMQIMEETTLNRMKRSASEVVRNKEGMKSSGILYSAMQIIDCSSKGLDVDVAYSGLDQRRIYMLGREVLPEINEDKPTCVFSPMVSGLTGGEMSASKEKSKISLHDTKEEVKDKIDSAYCPQGEKEDNGVLEYLQYLIFPILDKKEEKPFIVKRPEEYGGNLEYNQYSKLEDDFISGELHPQDLKNSVSEYIHQILEPIQKRFEGEEELLSKAYPEEY